MGRPRQISDEQILTVTREHVLQHGPNVSLDRVAADLQVTVPAILKRFGSRRALMLAALRPPEPRWLAQLLKGPSEAPLQAQLEEIFLMIADFNLTAVPCLSALRESGIPHKEVFGANDPTRGHKAMLGWLTKARERGLVTATELEAISFAIFGALMGRAFTAHLTNAPLSERSGRAYATEVARVFTRALTT